MSNFCQIRLLNKQMKSNVILSVVLLAVLVMAGSPKTAFSAPECLNIMPLTPLGAPTGKVMAEAYREDDDWASKKVAAKPEGIRNIKIRIKPLKDVAAKGQRRPAVDRDVGSLVIFNLLGRVDVSIDGEIKGQGSLAVADISTGMHELKIGAFSRRISISRDDKLRVKAGKDGITVLKDREEDWPGRTAAKEGEKRVSRPVAESDGRFMRYADGVVKDTKTGLEWVAGPDRDMTWVQAGDWVQDLRIDGGGWRMPTVKELDGLYQKGRGERNMTPLLKTTGWRVWAVERTGSASVKHFDFYFGARILDFRISNLPRAFAVRSRSPREIIAD